MRVIRSLWDPEPVPDPDSPLVILGTSFAPGAEWPERFLAVSRSIVWLMYRTNFPAIPRHPDGPSPLNLTNVLRSGAIDSSGFVTDVGWGCMIRTGQSLLANALMRLRFGADYVFDGDISDERAVLELFCDEPTAPFSIHSFVDLGTSKGKLPGEWFGPSTVASCIKSLSGPQINVYVSQGSDVYEDSLDKVQYPMLVLCGVRLGITAITPTYYNGIRACLDAPQSVGIAGGRTSGSHYFYGYQGSRLFYHDPHLPKSALRFSSLNDEFESVHSGQLRALGFDEMDPSMLIGFLLRDRADMADWKARMKSVDPRSQAVVINATEPECSDDETEGYVLCEDEEIPNEWDARDRGCDDESLLILEEPRRDEEVMVATPDVTEETTVLV